MKKYLSLTFIFSIALFSFNSYSMISSKKAAIDSVYKVIIYDKYNNLQSSGTGYPINKNGYFITNYHVVEKVRSGQIKLKKSGSDQLINAQLINTNKELDIAVLHVNKSTEYFFTLAYHSEGIGEQVLAIGFPGGAEMLSSNASNKFASVTGGVISRVERGGWSYGGNILSIQHDAAINPGNSGGPLVDGCSRVVGTNTLGNPDSQGIFFSSHATELAKYLTNEGIEFDLDRRDCGAWWDVWSNLSLLDNLDWEEIKLKATPKKMVSYYRNGVITIFALALLLGAINGVIKCYDKYEFDLIINYPFYALFYSWIYGLVVIFFFSVIGWIFPALAIIK